MKNSNVAKTPPMGWNSWDCFGASVCEEEVKQNARYVQQHLLSHGWQYIVVDIQWYEPTADGSVYHPFADLCMDAYGRLIPAENRFPSAANGKGFAPLAAYVHDLGLKFGIHIMRGIPRQAVARNTPILNSTHTAREIAHPYNICPWNTDMYGVEAAKPGAQAYYDSLLELYASWGVDFIKVDDISYTDFGKDTYAGRHEIELIENAIRHCGRDIVLSLSCGPAPLAHADHLMAHSHMWRITADLWDRWEDIACMFDTCAAWTPYMGDGHWPDADMLPLGHIALRGTEHGDGERFCRLTPAEQRTMMTLWCMAKSPLMIGAHLPDNDPATLELITNDEVLAVNQHASNPRQVLHAGYHDRFAIWMSTGEDGRVFLSITNLDYTPVQGYIDLEALGLEGTYQLRDLWEHQDCGCVTKGFEVPLEIHGSKLFSLRKKLEEA